MATSTRAFLIELYEEYLEEASFLYEQRLSLLKNPEISWKKIGEFEERFEAHIDGLVVGEGLALDVCRRRSQEGDFGELHAAVRVFCRQNKKDLLFGILEGFDLKDKENFQAVRDALQYELPDAWLEDLWLLSRTEPHLIPLLATIAAYRGLPVRDLEWVLDHAAPPDLIDIIWACGRLREPAVCDKVTSYLDHKDPAVQSIAALTLLRLGDTATLRRCLHSLSSSNWPAIPLGLSGSGMALRALLESRKDVLSYDQVIAIGLLGQVPTVPFLLSCLTNGSEAGAAAISLDLITGAHLKETVFIPDSVDEDELFEDEREKLPRDKAVLRPDGKPYGVTVRRLSQKPENWQEWWSENGSGFNQQIRYRYGQPYSHVGLIGVLNCEQSPHLVRRLAYEELAIRYGLDVRFETDMFVRQQEQALSRIELWAESNCDRFHEGCFYFAGGLLYD